MLVDANTDHLKYQQAPLPCIIVKHRHVCKPAHHGHYLLYWSIERSLSSIQWLLQWIDLPEPHAFTVLDTVNVYYLVSTYFHVFRAGPKVRENMTCAKISNIIEQTE